MDVWKKNEDLIRKYKRLPRCKFIQVYYNEGLMEIGQKMKEKTETPFRNLESL